MNSRLAAANEALAQGRNSDAVDLIIAALSEGVAPTVRIFSVLLHKLLALKRYQDGSVWAAKAVEFAPKEYDLLVLLGIFLRRTQQHDRAVEAFDRAIKLRPNDASALINKGHTLNDAKKGAAAEAVFTKLVRLDPRNSELQRALGRALRTQRKLDAAATRMRQATALRKTNVDAWLDLSAILNEQGHADRSLAALETAIGHMPDDERLLCMKARLFRQMGKAEESGKFLASISERFDRAAWYHHELGRLTAEVDHSQANIHHRRALELDPANVDYRLALAESLDRNRKSNEADNIEEAYRLMKDATPAPSIDPYRTKVSGEIFARSLDYEALDGMGSFSDLGRAWAESGRHTAFLNQLPRVRTSADRHELLKQHRIWGDLTIERARANPIRRPTKPKTTSKIRLGLMSSDLRDHPVTYFVWPLFEHADRDRFEIYCYSFNRAAEPGAAQAKIASMVDCFRHVPFINSHDAAEMIAGDQVDMLFELGGSTHMNKLDVMAWKPARLNASWLGYPHSAGLSTIDYLLVDPYLNPPDPSLLIEKPLIMPHSWIAMSKQAFPDNHEINPVAPVGRNGHITFGTANNPYKYNAELLRTWARVLARVDGSRFVFVRPEAGVPTFVRHALAYFEAEGVGSDRIEFRAIRGRHMPHYNDIDITLDTFPQTGGTTTCEAAWMGVPTVTLVGEALFERLSYSILTNAGLGDLCATSIEDYVDIAARLAADPDRIQQLRTGLRDQLRAGPLGQTRAFAQDFYDLVAAAVEGRSDAA